MHHGAFFTGEYGKHNTSNIPIIKGIVVKEIYRIADIKL
jgi:hypothetical protein